MAAHFAKRNTKFGGGGKKLESESEGGQKFLPPNPLPFCPPERSVWRAERAINSVQKRFGFRQTNAHNRANIRGKCHSALLRRWSGVRIPHGAPRKENLRANFPRGRHVMNYKIIHFTCHRINLTKNQFEFKISFMVTLVK